MQSIGSHSKRVACALVSLATAIAGGTPAGAAPGPPPPAQARATFAAGCFWSMQAIFQQLKGVQQVVPGYAGGTVPHPTYEQVETGNTGYAESVDVTYNPRVITYRQLLQVLLTARDPTSLNRQGPDEGTQYRSVIFYRTPGEKAAALQAIAQITAKHTWPAAIVTQVAQWRGFHAAEAYHWNYYNLHPDEPYCRMVIAPEISRFQHEYRGWLKAAG